MHRAPEPVIATQSAKNKRVRLKVQITRPVNDQTQAYWRCPGRGCQHYQNVLVGTQPERLKAQIECPTCRARYSIDCLYRNGGDLFVIAQLLQRGQIKVEHLESGLGDRENAKDPEG